MSGETRPVAILVLVAGTVLLALGSWLILRSAFQRSGSTRTPRRAPYARGRGPGAEVPRPRESPLDDPSQWARPPADKVVATAGPAVPGWSLPEGPPLEESRYGATRAPRPLPVEEEPEPGAGEPWQADTTADDAHPADEAVEGGSRPGPWLGGPAGRSPEWPGSPDEPTDDLLSAPGQPGLPAGSRDEPTEDQLSAPGQPGLPAGSPDEPTDDLLSAPVQPGLPDGSPDEPTEDQLSVPVEPGAPSREAPAAAEAGGWEDRTAGESRAGGDTTRLGGATAADQWDGPLPGEGAVGGEAAAAAEPGGRELSVDDTTDVLPVGGKRVGGPAPGEPWETDLVEAALADEADRPGQGAYEPVIEEPWVPPWLADRAEPPRQPTAAEPAPPAPTPPAPEPMRPPPEPGPPTAEPMPPVPEPMPSAREPMRPASEPMRPASEPMRPASEPMRRTPESGPAPETMRPAPEPGPPAPEPMRAAPELMRPTPEPMQPTAEPGPPTAEPVQSAPEPMRPAPEPGPPTAEPAANGFTAEAAAAVVPQGTLLSGPAPAPPPPPPPPAPPPPPPPQPPPPPPAPPPSPAPSASASAPPPPSPAPAPPPPATRPASRPAAGSPLDDWARERPFGSNPASSPSPPPRPTPPPPQPEPQRRPAPPPRDRQRQQDARRPGVRRGNRPEDPRQAAVYDALAINEHVLDEVWETRSVDVFKVVSSIVVNALDAYEDDPAEYEDWVAVHRSGQCDCH